MSMVAQPIVLSARDIQNMPEEGFLDGSTGGNVTWKTLLSSSRTSSDTLTSGLARCAAKGGQLKCHRHAHAEIYHVVQGHGTVTIDGKQQEVGKGDVVFIPGNSEHGIRNDHQEEDLVWLYVFAADKFEDVVYRFSEDATKAKL
ncbi:uncharacterized protein N0V89_009576 [Didymosphaeria variabile]|uniref:Cupin type-2 domain-containing protein n=1 Tax=Didymosphaeria variabile TaxID=1932322 RepID=A0A9W8XFE3_9PLEO|nr:uncharacterized protein N0V89_009576 [Didymosphaeria variabile]KAJ4348204.1 hypothetical protein N0V89_009576 [Didymosphaeria variabile]